MFKLEIATDNAAFHEDGVRISVTYSISYYYSYSGMEYTASAGAAEIARILRDTADRVAAGRNTNKLRDANGNTVGSVYWERES